MSRRIQAVTFAVQFGVLSLVFGWLFWVLGGLPAVDADVRQTMFVAPILSAMLASRGFPWRRKVVYSAITVGIYGLVSIVAQLAGVYEALDAGAGVVTSPLYLPILLYVAFVATFPLAMLVLFVGRNPQHLWSKAERGQAR